MRRPGKKARLNCQWQPRLQLHYLPIILEHLQLSSRPLGEQQHRSPSKTLSMADFQRQQQNAAAPPATQQQEQQQRLANYASGCPVIGGGVGGGVGPAPPSYAASGCPVVGANPANQMPPSANAPLPGQSKPLSTWRQQSSIPTGAEEAASLPAHQQGGAAGGQVWVYPSEQMFYNAMKRKGWSPSEDDMTAVVAIHNAVNERAWREIQRWEQMHGGAESCGGPRLVKFRGRPQEYSPKARLLNLLGYSLPFDRHDWIVDRCGEEVRYVIDFYNAAPLPEMPVAMHLDVRPAIDSFGALWDRLRMQWGWVASGRWRRE